MHRGERRSLVEVFVENGLEVAVVALVVVTLKATQRVRTEVLEVSIDPRSLVGVVRGHRKPRFRNAPGKVWTTLENMECHVGAQDCSQYAVPSPLKPVVESLLWESVP